MWSAFGVRVLRVCVCKHTQYIVACMQGTCTSLCVCVWGGVFSMVSLGWCSRFKKGAKMEPVFDEFMTHTSNSKSQCVQGISVSGMWSTIGLCARACVSVGGGGFSIVPPGWLLLVRHPGDAQAWGEGCSDT